MLAAHLLEDGADRFPAGHFSLAGVAERYLGVVLDKSLQVSDWSGPLSDEQIETARRVYAQAIRDYDARRYSKAAEGFVNAYELTGDSESSQGGGDLLQGRPGLIQEVVGPHEPAHTIRTPRRPTRR